MGQGGGVVGEAASRLFLLDERGVGLRATWHLDRGLVNLSIWRDDRCVETFRLAVGDAAALIGFLADGLADAAVDEPADRSPVT